MSNLFATERQISKDYAIPYKTLRRFRIDKVLKNICYTPPGSLQIIYDVQLFDEWFNKNKGIGHQDFNAQIKLEARKLERARKHLAKLKRRTT